MWYYNTQHNSSTSIHIQDFVVQAIQARGTSDTISFLKSVAGVRLLWYSSFRRGQKVITWSLAAREVVLRAPTRFGYASGDVTLYLRRSCLMVNCGVKPLQTIYIYIYTVHFGSLAFYWYNDDTWSRQLTFIGGLCFWVTYIIQRRHSTSNSLCEPVESGFYLQQANRQRFREMGERKYTLTPCCWLQPIYIAWANWYR